MAPQRLADAASVVPYPYVVRQERAEPSSSAAEPADSGRHAKGKKAKGKQPRTERSPRQEEDPKFNTGPRNLRTAPANRGRRGFRMPGRVYPQDQNGVPDYPPPSFLEAINTPPLSVCSSTTSLVSASATNVPLAFPEVILEHIPEDPQPSEDVSDPAAANDPVVPENNDGSDSDDSVCIIDMNSIPIASTDLPRGRSKTDWRSRLTGDSHGRLNSEFPSKAKESVDPVRSKPIKLPPLEIDPNPTADEVDRALTPVATPKRRFLSLSPLRTIFPTKSPVHHARAMSAHPSPSPSPYSVSRATFFRSSSSLTTSFLPTLPSLSHNKSENITRRIFAHRGKDDSKAHGSPEELNTWEYLNEEAYAGVDKQGVEHPPSLMSAIASLRNLDPNSTSPTRSQSFTFGAHSPTVDRLKQPYGQSSETILDTSDLSLRDWKGPSTAFIDRTVNRRSPLSPSTTTLSSDFSGTNTLSNAATSMSSLSLPFTPVRATTLSAPSAPTLSPKRTVHGVIHPSPLRINAKPNLTINNQATTSTVIWQKALETPLPETPVYHSRFDYRIPSSESGELAAASAASRLTPDLLTYSGSDEPEVPIARRRIPPLHISTHPSSISSLESPTPVAVTGSLGEPMTPTRHHYTGRPLPRPPATANRSAIVDSTYASLEGPDHHGSDQIAQNARSYNSCPEGLLIDLEDTTLDYSSASGTSTPRSEEGFQSQYHLPMMSRTASSDELALDTPSTEYNVQGHSTPPRSSSPGLSYASQQTARYSELTDLDLLLSRLSDGEHDGSDYETLLLVSELIGPADPAQARGAQQASERALCPTPLSNNSNANMSLIGRIEVMRRRKTDDGRVKVKIKLLDIAVDKCGICLSQFKHGDMAVLTSICQHSFHEICAGRWLARAKTCPLCRVPLDTDVR